METSPSTSAVPVALASRATDVGFEELAPLEADALRFNVNR